MEQVVSTYTLDWFQQHFRMKRGTFEIVLQHMGNLREFANLNASSRGTQKIKLDKMLLMTLWYLGNRESFRGIPDRFGVAKSSAYKCTRKICFSIVKHLIVRFIRWQTLNEATFLQVRQGFQSGYPLPGCIDSTHVPIKAPREPENAYVNRKGCHSIILQGVCNHERRFTDVFCGCVGSTHDATVLRSSPLYCSERAGLFYRLCCHHLCFKVRSEPQ